MQRTIVITDLTKMWGDGVCIAGIDDLSQCIRPVLRPGGGGVPRRYLYIRDKLVIRPRAKVRFDFRQVRIELPHIEDLGFAPDSINYLGLCSDSEWESIPQANLFNSVEDIYEGFLQQPRWVAPGANTRSLGTVSGIRVTSIRLREWSGTRKYRLCFVDDTGREYDDVTISDLAFRAFLDAEVSRVESLVVATDRVKNLLKAIDRLYLRLGLARPWLNPSTGRMECWMQVTGIYTFPDYLGGRSFADF